MPTLVVGMFEAWRDDCNDRWQCVAQWLWDQGDEALYSYPLYRYVWGPRYIDELIYRDQCNTGTGVLVQRLYAMQDANYNVVALAEEDGDVVERFIYDAYGRATVLDPAFTADADNTSDYAWQYLYTGRQLDSETGLMDYRNRCYHTGLGRFVTRDPIGYKGSPWNLYEYVVGSPTTRHDPFGEGEVGDIVKVIGSWRACYFFYNCKTFGEVWSAYYNECEAASDKDPMAFYERYGEQPRICPIVNPASHSGAMVRCVVTLAKDDLSESDYEEFLTGFQKCLKMIRAALAAVGSVVPKPGL